MIKQFTNNWIISVNELGQNKKIEFDKTENTLAFEIDID